MKKNEWLLCPNCNNKTRIKICDNTVLENFPLYTLLNVDRGVPEVWGSTYDIRDLLNASVMLRDGRPLTDMKVPFIEKAVLHELLRKIHGTDIEKLLVEYHIIG